MEQVYYTACPVGYGLGAGSGYQVKRITPGYQVTGDWRQLAFHPFVRETKALAPGALRYWRHGDAATVSWITPRATEFETERGGWGRPGGYLAHVVRLEAREI